MSKAISAPASTDQLGFGFEDLAPPLPASPASPSRKPRLLRVAPPAPALSPEAMAQQLDQHADFRVLRRLPVQQRFVSQPLGATKRVLILDTETTGLDHTRDRIMELALLGVDVDTVTGLPTGEVEVYDGLEDPGMPIPREIQQITGINDDMVRGHKLDEERVHAMLAGADMVIAHNAGFDRPFVEARLGRFADIPWACSFADLDWKAQGRSSAKLTQLALEMGWFYDAHRAEMDCHALLAVLACPLPVSGQTGLALLLAATGQPGFRLQATAAPFEVKDLLKARGYRWDAVQKVWQIRLQGETALQDECVWLKANAYNNRAVRVQLEALDAITRYSSRPGKLSLETL